MVNGDDLRTTGSPPKTIAIRGALDLATAASVMDDVGALLADDPVAIDIDLSGLAYTDSVGLSVFVTWHFQCVDAGVRLRFLDPSPLVGRMLDASGLSEILEIKGRDVLVA